MGGQLQGLEAVYLAQQAGFETALIDKNLNVPARALVDEFYHIDLLRDGNSARDLLKEFDLIIPATENYNTLLWLNETAHNLDIPLALDMLAYSISCSKKKSNRLFSLSGIPIAEQWPECEFPVIVKPSNLSGSLGVERVNDFDYLRALLNRLGPDVVVEQFLDGPSYSLEVLADRGKCVGLQVTELCFDAGFDCKRVIAGPNTGAFIADEFFELGNRISQALNLRGIMDIEIIATGEGLKVLEIDARLPSQTPAAVFHSRGINMISLLAEYWIKGKLPDRVGLQEGNRAVIYEHLRFKRGTLEVAGEHILIGAKGLKLYKDIFLTDVLISNFEESPNDWAATVIFTDEDETRVWEKRNKGVKAMQHHFRALKYVDCEPPNEGGGQYNKIVL